MPDVEDLVLRQNPKWPNAERPNAEWPNAEQLNAECHKSNRMPTDRTPNAAEHQMPNAEFYSTYLT
jgi:hypothetical protein